MPFNLEPGFLSLRPYNKVWMWTLIGVMVVGSVLYSQVEYVLDSANPAGAGFVPVMQVRMLKHLGRVRMEQLEVMASTEVLAVLENELPKLSDNIDAVIDGISNFWQLLSTLCLVRRYRLNTSG